MIEKENIQGYINFESGVPKKAGLLSFLYIMLIVCIPSAIFGAYANITKIVMLPLVVVMGLWIVYLLIKTDTKILQFTFFVGVFCVFISVSFFVAAYKMADMVMRVPNTYVLLTVIAYIITNLIGIFNTLRLIKNGYYKVKKKSGNSMGTIVAAGFFGLCIGRLVFGKNIGQTTGIAIVVIVLMLLGFLSSIGTNNFVKYYYAKKLKSYIN